MKKLFLAAVAMFFAVVMTGPAFAEYNVGINTYASASGYDVGIYSAEMNAWAPGFQLDTQQDAVVGALNGMSGISEYTDATRGAGYALVNTGADASAQAGWWGIAVANANNSTVFQVPGVIGIMNNNLDLSASFGGQADGSSSSTVIIGN